MYLLNMSTNLEEEEREKEKGKNQKPKLKRKGKESNWIVDYIYVRRHFSTVQ